MVRADGPMTSEVLAKAMGTNPVVVRRTMGGLRDHGYVTSEKGHGGGWSLSCDIASVTLYDIYLALGCPPLLAIGHRNETSECLVEQSINAALGDAFDEAEALLLERLREVTLVELNSDVSGRLARRHPGRRGAQVHE